MSANVIVLPEAEQDALEAFRYVRRFRGLRRSLLKRFPSAVVVVHHESSDTIQVLAIMHMARAPERWQRRAWRRPWPRLSLPAGP